MKSRLWCQNLEEVVANPHDWEAYRLFMREAEQLLDNVHPLLDAHVLKYHRDDCSLDKALWMLLNDALDTLRDCVELTQNHKHHLVGKMFRDLVEVLDLTCYFHAQTPQSKADLAKWYDDKVVSHRRYRDYVEKALGEKEALESRARHRNFSRWTHHNYRTLLNSYSLGRDDLLVYDGHAPTILVLPQTLSQYLWALGQFISEFLVVLRQVGFASEAQVATAKDFIVPEEKKETRKSQPTDAADRQ